MSEKSITFVAKNGSVDDALHVTASVDLGGGNVNLIAVAIGVVDGGTVNDAIEASPKRCTHAHWAWLAGGVERITGERYRFETPGGLANSADFSVGAGVEFLLDGIERTEKQLTGFCVDDGGTEGAGAGSIQGASSEGHER